MTKVEEGVKEKVSMSYDPSVYHHPPPQENNNH